MQLLIASPVLIPLVAAALGMIAARRPGLQKAVSLAGGAAHLGAAVWLLAEAAKGEILVLQLGRWPAPFGISFVVDIFGAVMVLLAAITGFAALVYSLRTVDERRARFFYYPLMQVLIMGVSGAFITGDLFNLYVFFEVLLVSSFVLLSLGGERAQLEGGLKYVVLNLIASAIFLVAAGILYGATGALNFADLAVKVAASDSPGVMTACAALLMVSFGIKSAAFPLFFWLPASYHTPPFAVSAVFAGLLTKVGVYALARVFTLVFTHDTDYTHTIILGAAALTMVSGVLGAASQFEFRKVLSFHIVSQIGYMLMGLGLFTRLAVAGMVFYIAHHIIVKANLFFVAGAADRLRGTSSLKTAGRLGLYRHAPLLAVLFMIPAMSLAGVPPLSGFFAKLLIIRAGLGVGAWAVVAVALVVGALTLYSMTKIWAEVFWKSPDVCELSDEEARRAVRAVPRSMLAPIAALAALTVAIGLGTEPVFRLSLAAADQLLDPAGYVEAVLGAEAAAGLRGLGAAP